LPKRDFARDGSSAFTTKDTWAARTHQVPDIITSAGRLTNFVGQRDTKIRNCGWWRAGLCSLFFFSFFLSFFLFLAFDFLAARHVFNLWDRGISLMAWCLGYAINIFSLSKDHNCPAIFPGQFMFISTYLLAAGI
jgi:hypothetical protein